MEHELKCYAKIKDQKVPQEIDLNKKQGVQQAGGVCIAETLDKAERAVGEQEWARPKG